LNFRRTTIAIFAADFSSMTDSIGHECGIALIKLRKPLQYYIDKYQSSSYGLNKMYLLMEKQHNRGQDGAGLATVKSDLPPGMTYIDAYKSVEKDAIDEIFAKINRKLEKALEDNEDKIFDAQWLKAHVPCVAELYLGHLRYGTYGKNKIENCHPMLRQNNWRNRNLVLAGNFNMTNNDLLFQKLVSLGQHPRERIDTVTVLEKVGHFLDDETEKLYYKYREQGFERQEIVDLIDREISIEAVLRRACKDFDGGYAIAGLVGNGISFVVRDPSGIRPAYFYADSEVVVVASEKPAIKTSFNADYSKIQEILPGHALIIHKDGNFSQAQIQEPKAKKSCSFERIYFSRGSDPQIYQERKKLGELLFPTVLDRIQHDLHNTVFSYIPNTAETAFLGMVKGIDKYLISLRQRALSEGNLDENLLTLRPRVEKLVIKDVKLRTFITAGKERADMIAHVYDTTYEVIRKGIDTIVVIDDSIVRGSTLKGSIIRMLDKLEPKKIIIVSSAPQIRYPDCYGIDMANLKDLVAFNAILELLKDSQRQDLLDQTYMACVEEVKNPSPQPINHVKKLYDCFDDEQISAKIAQLVKHESVQAEVEVIFQSVENLHKACSEHLGDWYFTGNYPTPGGMLTANKAFINFMEGKEGRAYD
jgi:amidophosphoribosyltransferase